jgi:hypothetical protein
MESLWQDLRYGLRMMVRQPGFSAVAVITRDEINRIGAQLGQEYPRANLGLGYQLFLASALPEQYYQGATGILGFSIAVAGLVLLVACANIASIWKTCDLLSSASARPARLLSAASRWC